MAKVSIIEASKQRWNTNSLNNDGYPGDRNIELGCLQRMATACETMAHNHDQLVRDRDMYKRWYEERGKCVNKLRRSNAALRGVITKMKGKR